MAINTEAASPRDPRYDLVSSTIVSHHEKQWESSFVKLSTECIRKKSVAACLAELLLSLHLLRLESVCQNPRPFHDGGPSSRTLRNEHCPFCGLAGLEARPSEENHI